jgi:hypothetical protein
MMPSRVQGHLASINIYSMIFAAVHESAHVPEAAQIDVRLNVGSWRISRHRAGIANATFMTQAGHSPWLWRENPNWYLRGRATRQRGRDGLYGPTIGTVAVHKRFKSSGTLGQRLLVCR